MSLDVRFDLDAVVKLAEHAAAAAEHVHPAGTGHTGPALLLHTSHDGIWLTSNGLLGLGRIPAAAPGQQQTPTPDGPTLLAEMLPLGAPADNPLLGQLRAGAAAGYQTLIVRTSGDAGLDLAVARRRPRPAATSPHQR